jgi:hypothetical protein
MGGAGNVQALINQTLRSRILATYALCAVAEDEINAGQFNKTLQTVKAIRRMISDINVLACGPIDRPSLSDINEAADMLAELENRIQTIEQTIGPSPRFH